jgi:hypothetical protein
MRTGVKMRLGASLLALAAATAAHGQAGGAATRILVSSAGLEPVPGEIVREIDDPHTGARWLLMRDPSHPAGPGRLVLAGGFRNHLRPGDPGVEPSRTVIRAGDRLVVEENTPVVEARLEAVALGPAVLGSPLEVRLKIGGKVVRAVALGPGRTAFQTEARP